MDDRLDDLRGLRSVRAQHRPHPWVNTFLIAFGTVIVVSETLALFAGRPFDGFELIFGWDLGSWDWAGRLVVIVGWIVIVAQNLRLPTWAWDAPGRLR